MAIVETVKIISENPKYPYTVINKADFHSGHTLFDPLKKKSESIKTPIKKKAKEIKKEVNDGDL